MARLAAASALLLFASSASAANLAIPGWAHGLIPRESGLVRPLPRHMQRAYAARICTLTSHACGSACPIACS